MQIQNNSVRRRNFFILLADSFKGAILAGVVTVLLIMLFALCIQLFSLADSMIPIVNTAIKVISLLIGALLTLWKRPEQGWLRGLLCGLIYALVLYVAFALADGVWVFGWASLFDILLSTAIGAVSGILMVNVRTRLP